MSVVAIISEYNPFHNGHKYQIDRIRDELPGSTIISIMSGNVVQRGEFAFIDKYTRARLAVENGIDCVFELPYPYSGSTAEIFATAGVKIANSLGADYLYFGIESNNLNDIEKIAYAIDSDEYEKAIKLLVNESNESFPILREKALKSLGIDVSNTSNDMLAVEYIRAIKNNSLNLKYRAIKRVGAGYNDDTVCDLMSASAIRKQFYETGKILSITNRSKKILTDVLDNGEYVDVDNSNRLLLQHVILGGPVAIEKSFDCPSGLGHYIYGEAKKCSNTNELSMISSKSITSARIRRTLIYSLFGVENVDKEIMYTTLLAMNEKGKAFLSCIKKKTDIVVVTKHSDSKKLSKEALHVFELNCKVDELYQTLLKKSVQVESVYKKCPYIEKKNLG